VSREERPSLTHSQERSPFDDIEPGSEKDVLIGKTAAGPPHFYEPLNERIKTEFQIPYSFLLATQWNEIRKKTGLQSSAWLEINIALQRYWYHYLEEYHSPTALTTVEDAEANLNEAMEAISAVLNHKEVFKGPLEYDRLTPLQQRGQLEKVHDAMLKGKRILGHAKERLTKDSKGRKSYGPLHILIHHLDFIVTNGARMPVNSKKKRPPGNMTSYDVVMKIVKIAKPDIKEGTVETMIKRYMSERKKGDRGFPKRSI
jgi:hypothetical protein